MKKVARVVLWRACNRDCEHCCNKQATVMAQGLTVPDMGHIRGYDEVLLTGGEPMLAPYRLPGFASQARAFNPNCRVYLYSALWDKQMWDVIECVDGVHFTVHAPATSKDVAGFLAMQAVAANHSEKSFRLHLDPALKVSITLLPRVWERIENKPWLSDCPLPENETLYFLGGP